MNPGLINLYPKAYVEWSSSKIGVPFYTPRTYYSPHYKDPPTQDHSLGESFFAARSAHNFLEDQVLADMGSCQNVGLFGRLQHTRLLCARDPT